MPLVLACNLPNLNVSSTQIMDDETYQTESSTQLMAMIKHKLWMIKLTKQNLSFSP